MTRSVPISGLLAGEHEGTRELSENQTSDTGRSPSGGRQKRIQRGGRTRGGLGEGDGLHLQRSGVLTGVVAGVQRQRGALERRRRVQRRAQTVHQLQLVLLLERLIQRRRQRLRCTEIEPT